MLWKHCSRQGPQYLLSRCRLVTTQTLSDGSATAGPPTRGNKEIVSIFIRDYIAMELVIKDIKSAKDIKLFTELANRLGLKAAKLTAEEKEDIGMAMAIQKGRKSGYVSEEAVLKTLRAIKEKISLDIADMKVKQIQAYLKKRKLSA